MCIIENKRTHFPVAHLMVVKHLVPSGDAGVFDLLIGGKVWAPGVSNHGSTGRLEFELGKHTVTEHAVDGTNLADFAVSTTCVNRAGHTVAHNAHGPSVTVDLASASDDIVRTITNQRPEGPEGGGQIPDIPGPLFAVEKRMPAPVGEDVPFSIVVHNRGHVTATGVQTARDPARRHPDRRRGGPRHDRTRRHRRMASRAPATRRVADGPRHAARHAPGTTREHSGRHRAER